MSLLNENLVSLSQCACRLPAHRGKGRVSPVTVWRWIKEGIVLPSGERLRLEAIRLCGRWLTSTESLERFTAAQTAAHLSPATVPQRVPPRSTKARIRASDRAALDLAKAGV